MTEARLVFSENGSGQALQDLNPMLDEEKPHKNQDWGP